MANIYDISSTPDRFAAEVTRRAENATTLPEEMPDFSGMINAKITYPAGTFTGRIIGGDRVEQEAIIDALIERGRV